MIRTLMTYPLPTGGRSLILVRKSADAEHPYVLLDAPAEGPLDRDADIRVVEADLDSDSDALGLAVEHWALSERLGYPADPLVA